MLPPLTLTQCVNAACDALSHAMTAPIHGSVNDVARFASKIGRAYNAVNALREAAETFNIGNEHVMPLYNGLTLAEELVLLSGRTIHAIKAYRERTGVSLYDAKHAVERARDALRAEGRVSERPSLSPESH